MNEITSINFIYPNLWAGLLQGLTVMQQCVYQIKFRNVCEVKEATGTAWIGLEQNFIDTAVNEWRKHLFACVRIVGQHFKQFYYMQLKSRQLDEMSAKVSKGRGRKYLYQKLSKSDNWFSSYGRKCRGCFLRHSVYSCISSQRGQMFLHV